MISFQTAEAESIQYLAKACQSLAQALNLALKSGDKVYIACHGLYIHVHVCLLTGDS